jgi:D-arabinose 1-dehydrogenase-like Zn-dependent alcohol dehydrogenase
MKAAVLHKIGEALRIGEVPTPKAGPDELVIRTTACGICGTDLHIRDGWGYTPELPFIMGHEPAGVVVEVGERVTKFKPGDRAVPNIFFTCGNCFYCRTNRETQCLHLEGILGVLTYPGGYGEFFKVRERQLFHLPETISFSEGAVIADAVVTAVHAVRRGRVAPEETVMVISVGGCSAAAIQVCKAYGARVISVVRSQEKRERALRLGADAALDSRQTSIPGAVMDLTDGLGVHCVIDGVGNADTMNTGMESLCRGGRLVILGYTQDRHALDPRKTAVHELEIIGTRSGGRDDTAESIRLVGVDTWVPVVTDSFPIEQVEEAHALMRQGKNLGRIVLTFEE